MFELHRLAPGGFSIRPAKSAGQICLGPSFGAHFFGAVGQRVTHLTREFPPRRYL